MTAIPTEHRHHRRLTWSIVAVLIFVVVTLSARWGLHVYRCHAVNHKARQSGTNLYVEPCGPQSLHRHLSEPLRFAFSRPIGGGELEFDISDPSAEIDHIIWCLSGLDSLTSVAVQGAGVTDSHLLQLRNLLRLKSLGLQETRVTAAGLTALDELRHLKTLMLGNAIGVDDAALNPISRVSGLENLFLEGTSVTDAGLKQLSLLTNLRRLSLDRTAISNIGLIELKVLPKLRELSISQTRVTDKGIDALRKSLPNLEVTDD